MMNTTSTIAPSQDKLSASIIRRRAARRSPNTLCVFSLVASSALLAHGDVYATKTLDGHLVLSGPRPDTPVLPRRSLPNRVYLKLQLQQSAE